MLVLSRKENESLILKLPNGDQIDIMITAVNGEQVGLGIDAPREVIVWREELTIKKEKDTVREQITT